MSEQGKGLVRPDAPVEVAESAASEVRGDAVVRKSPTRGPWVAGIGSVGGPVIMATTDEKTWCVASCTTSKCWYGPKGGLRFEDAEPEAWANALLIAAAPELLAACKALQMEAAARGCGLRIADEAIAKAESRS